MGDKSPKSIEQKKKQAAAEKIKKQADAQIKSRPGTAELGKRGK